MITSFIVQVYLSLCTSLSRRCLMSILADFFTPEIIHDAKYKFSQSGKYFAPPKGTYESYVEFIKVSLCDRTL